MGEPFQERLEKETFALHIVNAKYTEGKKKIIGRKKRLFLLQSLHF